MWRSFALVEKWWHEFENKLVEREASICSRFLPLSVFPWCEDSKLVCNLHTDEPLWKGKKKNKQKQSTRIGNKSIECDWLGGKIHEPYYCWWLSFPQTITWWLPQVTLKITNTSHSQDFNHADDLIWSRHMTSGARFSKVPKLFGWQKSLWIFNRNTFRALKLCSYFVFSFIWNILKERVFTASGS